MGATIVGANVRGGNEVVESDGKVVFKFLIFQSYIFLAIFVVDILHLLRTHSARIVANIIWFIIIRRALGKPDPAQARAASKKVAFEAIGVSITLKVRQDERCDACSVCGKNVFGPGYMNYLYSFLLTPHL